TTFIHERGSGRGTLGATMNAAWPGTDSAISASPCEPKLRALCVSPASEAAPRELEPPTDTERDRLRVLTPGAAPASAPRAGRASPGAPPRECRVPRPGAS